MRALSSRAPSALMVSAMQSPPRRRFPRTGGTVGAVPLVAKSAIDERPGERDERSLSRDGRLPSVAPPTPPPPASVAAPTPPPPASVAPLALLLLGARVLVAGADRLGLRLDLLL